VGQGATAYLRERYAAGGGCQAAPRPLCFQGWLHFGLGGNAAVGRRGI